MEQLSNYSPRPARLLASDISTIVESTARMETMTAKAASDSVGSCFTSLLWLAFLHCGSGGRAHCQPTLKAPLKSFSTLSFLHSLFANFCVCGPELDALSSFFLTTSRAHQRLVWVQLLPSPRFSTVPPPASAKATRARRTFLPAISLPPFFYHTGRPHFTSPHPPRSGCWCWQGHIRPFLTEPVSPL